jgi:hypothetical protein
LEDVTLAEVLGIVPKIVTIATLDPLHVRRNRAFLSCGDELVKVISNVHVGVDSHWVAALSFSHQVDKVLIVRVFEEQLGRLARVDCVAGSDGHIRRFRGIETSLCEIVFNASPMPE